MRKLVSLVLALCMVLTLASFPATAAGENPYRVKIFTMGDSFTQGVIEQNAYRYYIYEPLIKDGAVFEFIGPSSSGDWRVTDLYKKHGGVGGAIIGCANDYKWNGSGWVTNAWSYTNPDTGKTINTSGSKNSIHYRLFAGSDGTNDYTKTEYGNYVAQADIVTLYIGLNDYYSSGTTGLSADIEHVKQRYYTVVDRIYEINPDVSLYVCSLNEVSGLRGYGKTEAENTDYANSLYKYNEFVLNDVVEHYTEKGYKIQGISLNQEGYKMVSGDTPSDDGHPNHKGNRKIGTQIYMGIKDEVLALNAQGSDVAYNPTRVTGITVDTTSVTLKKGENKTIESTITPSNAEIISVIFSSSNESVATVDGYGRVTAVGEGTATIYATALDSLRPGATELKAACTVTVTADEYEKVGENFLPVFHEKFDAKGPWTGSTDSISESGSVFKHNNVASASITSRKTVDLNTKFSMAFNVAVMGHEMKETNASNRESYYAYLEVGDYQLRVAVNGKSVSFYYDGVLKAEKIFKVPVTRQNDDRYTLVKDGATVCVYRNNELLFTTAVDEYDAATGNVTIATKGYGTINIRDVELKSIRGLVKLDSTAIKYSTATTFDGTSYPITNALDGDLKTDYAIAAWKGETPVEWTTDSRFVILDLGDYYDVTNLNIYWGHQGGSWGRSVPDAYNVSYSKDNVTYTPALSYSGINSIMVGNSTESYSDIDTSFTMTAPSWATGANAVIYGYGNVKESELDWEGVRYVKIEMTSVTYNPTIAEIEVYATQYMPGEEPNLTATTYTVNYVDTEGNPVAESKTESGYVGYRVTETAVAVDGYIPDKESVTITLIDGTNTITFTYTKVEATAAVDIFPIYAFSNYAPQDSVNFIGSAFDGVATADWGRYFRPAKTFAQSAAKGADGNFYVVADLGSPYNLTELYQKWGANYATKVAVYGSNDQTNWTEIADIARSAQESTDAMKHAGYYRYVKVEAYSYTTSNCPAILELAFKGTLSPNYEKVSLTVNSAPQQKGDSTPKENITDGTLTKAFTSSLYNSSITEVTNYNVVLELEKATAIDRLTIFWGNRPEWGHVAPDSYTVYVSADGTNYTPLKDKYTGMLAIATAGEDTTYTDSDTAVFCTSRSETNHRLAVSEYNLNTEEIKFIKVEVNSFKYSFSIAEIEVFAKKEGGTTEPDEPDTPVEPEKEPITLAPAGVSAPTNTDGKPFALATDGDNTTFYAVLGYYSSLSTVNYQMVFDIGYLGKVDSLDILWGADSWGNTTPDAYKVEVSSDGTTWTQKKSYSGIYDITTGAAVDNISGKDTVFGITTSKWAVDNNDTNVNAYTQGNILEKNLGWENVRYIRVTVTSAQYRLAMREVTIGSLPNDDQILLSKGGQIRLADTDENISAGLRFGASIIKMNTGIEGEYKYSDDADTKFGMFMLPKDMLDGKTLTAYLANGVQQALDVPARKIYEQDDNFITYTAVLTGIPESGYNTDIVAVPYMLKDGEYTYFEEMTKSYVGVAEAARNSTYSDTAIAAVTDETLKAEMQAVADELDKIIEAAKEEIVVRTLPFSRGINVNKMETFLSENTYGAFEEGIEELTNEATYTNIKSQGFDHVRLPVNFYTIYYEATSYGYTTEQLMGYVDTAINLAIKNGLYVTLDFHGWFYIGSEENDYEEFIYCWTQVAERYKDYSDMLSFELLNEPWYTNGQAQQYLSDSRLSQMQVEAINIIRNTGSNNAERLIIICTADGNKAWKISALSAELKACKNIALAIHEYSPYNFTHQNFSWAGLGGKTTTLADAGGLSGVNYDFSLIKKFVEETGIPVVLNEFGLNLDKASDEDIDTYIRHITTFCETNNIPWAYWQYSGGYSSEGSMSLYRKTSRYGSQAWDEFALDALFLR